eukprot:gene20064-26371_t
MKYDCGYLVDEKDFALHDPSCSSSHLSVLPIRTPEAWSWQHFVDSALPKIFAARELMLQHPEILISIDQSKSASPGKVLELIGLANRTVKGGYRQGSTPYHPVQWGQIAALLRDTRAVGQGTIVLLRRTASASRNQKRFLHNEDDVMKALMRAAARNSNDQDGNGNGGESKFLPIDPAETTFEEMRAIIGGASVVVGAHGGAMYNLLFADPSASVIEFVPDNSQGLNIFSLLSTMVGHNYIRCMEKKAGNGMQVDVAKLEAVAREALALSSAARKQRTSR